MTCQGISSVVNREQITRSLCVMYDVGQSAQLFLSHGLADVTETLICIKANYWFSDRRL